MGYSVEVDESEEGFGGLGLEGFGVGLEKWSGGVGCFGWR